MTKSFAGAIKEKGLDMPKQKTLFPLPKRKRRVIAHMIDAGNNPYVSDCPFIAEFECKKCGKKTGYIEMPTISSIKKGVPCENCNERKTHE